MANYITDQKGRLLTSVFPAFRGDASIGGSEVIEVTVDLSQIGTGTSLSALGVQSGFPNAGVGLNAADTVDIAVLPYNFQVQSVQFIADTNAPTPDILPAGNLTGLTGLTYSLGRYAVATADRSTAVTVTGFTGAATTYASGATLSTGSAINGSSLIYTTGTDFLPYITPAASGSLETTAAVYVLRLTIGTLTGGSSTGVKAGKFRFRVGGIVYGI
jgi:hypothetical protein